MFFFLLDAVGIAREQRLEIRNLDRTIEFVDAVREVDGTLSVGALGTLLHVVKNLPELASGDMTLGDLAQKMGVASTSVARQLEVLTDGGPSGGGLRLLQKAVHPHDKRKRQIVATPKGMVLLDRLSAIMGAGDELGENGAIGVPDQSDQIREPRTGKSDPEIR